MVLVGYSIYETILNLKVKDTCKEYQTYIENKHLEDSLKLTDIKTHLNFNFDFFNFDMYANKLISNYDIEGKLVFYFRYEHCGACVLKILSEIDSMLVSGIISFEDIVLLGQNIDENPFTFKVLEKYDYNVPLFQGRI